MPSVFLYILDTMADWEPGHVLAELVSGQYLKDPSSRFNLVTCALTTNTITTMGGLRLKPDARVTDIRPVKGDLLLLPGGNAWFDPAQAPVIEKAREALDAGVAVAAICGATFALANAGLLDTRRHTSNDLEALRQFCPGYHGEQFYVNEPAVADGNLVTAGGAGSVAFACQVFRLLDVMRPATLEAWYGLYTTREPRYFYALMESLPGRSGTQ